MGCERSFCDSSDSRRAYVKRWLMNVGSLVALLCAALLLTPWMGRAEAQVLARRECHTNWQGQAVRGVMQVERLMYYDTHRIYGQFRDQSGNLIEFEILTNQPGGVGGMWFNNARHREVRIQLQMLNDGFVVTGDAGSARYYCP